MKTKTILQALVLLFIVITASAQQGINYKAIINDANGEALVITPFTIQFTILENGTTPVYQETHNPTTDSNGIVIVNIGEGTVVSGVYNDVDWGSNPHFLKTEINTGCGLTDMGTTEFKTLHYALHALKSSGDVSELNELIDAKTSTKSVYIGESAGNVTNTAQNLNNTAIKFEALTRNYYNNNTAVGHRALYNNTNTSFNTAIGSKALTNNSGAYNTAVCNEALVNISAGRYNTSIGSQALASNTIGNNNIGIGYNSQIPDNTASNQVRIGNSLITYAGIQVAWTITSDISQYFKIIECIYKNSYKRLHLCITINPKKLLQ